MTYEQQLQQLETLIKQLENGDLSLDQTLAAYEQGVALIRACQQQLEQAEQRIQLLAHDGNGEETLVPFVDPGDYLWGIFPALASLFAAVALWQYGHASLGAMLIPAPDVVFARAVNILANASERQNVILTLYRASIGISLALTIGISAGLIAGSSRTLSLLTRPIITVLLGTPPIIWVVLAIFWYNMGSTSVIFTVTITTLPLVFAAAQMSVMTLPTPLSEMLSSYRVPLARRLKAFYLPHILRQLLPALIVAVGTGLKITVMAELLGSNDGIGSAIGSARAMLDTVDVMAYVVLIVTIIMSIEYGLLEPLRRLFDVTRRQ